YLTLNHRHSESGYHWALVYASKDSVKNSDDDDAPDGVRWDLSNEHMTPEGRRTTGPWYQREKEVNQYRSISLIARIMLAKFEPQQKNNTVSALKSVLSKVHFDPDLESGQTCRVWALDAIEELMKQGLVRLKVNERQKIEDWAKTFADQQMELMAKKKLKIEKAEDIPIGDLRKT
ncbi:hypothetical protein C8J57DRAFT_193824, partial [Mycena rebaudengoi]